jgi:chromosomal replication initiation ATPase DnaA
VFQLGELEFISTRRSRKVVDARMTFFWLARRLTTRSNSQIGDWAGGRDHSTVLHGYDRVNSNMDIYRPWIELVAFDLGADIGQALKEAA